jgi:hypothetical protein
MKRKHTSAGQLHAQAVAASILIAGDSGKHGTEDGSDQRGRDSDAQQVRREMVDLREIAGGAGDDRGIEAEQQASQCGYYGALQQVGIWFHPIRLR